MQRRQALFLAGYDSTSFNNYARRDQLPVIAGSTDDNGSRYTNYSLDDAWRLRLHRDLIGNEPQSGVCGECGVSPAGAKAIVGNALSHSDGPLAIGDAFHAPADIWIGVIVYQETYGPDPIRFTEWFKGEMAGVNDQIANALTKHSADYPRSTLEPVRIVTVNASRAARFVVQRAREFHLPEISEIEVARK